MSTARFAAIVHVGAGARDMVACLELLTALVEHEPDIAACVVIDDAGYPRGLSELALIPKSCRATTIVNMPQQDTRRWRGGLFEALRWVHANEDVDFVLKIQTDALVIAPFCEAIRSLMATEADAGLIGTLGVSSNPNVRAMPLDWHGPYLLRAYQRVPHVQADADTTDEPLVVAGVGTISPQKHRLFEVVRPCIETAVRNGYCGTAWCDEGAFAMSRPMLDRMVEAGYLEHEASWKELPFLECNVLEMYAFAVGMRTCDYSAPGQPFALQCSGLPFDLDELLSRGHSLVRSVRNDLRYGEEEIRGFFRERLPLPSTGRPLSGASSHSVAPAQLAAKSVRRGGEGLGPNERQPPRFAVVVPVGPTSSHLEGAADLVSSLLYWEPQIAHCIFVENTPRPTGLAEFVSARSTCQARAFQNPGYGITDSWVNGVNAGILASLDWLQRNADVEFVLRLDTDALVIGPFAKRIQQFLVETPEAGVIGSRNGSCNLIVRALIVDPHRETNLQRWRRLLPNRLSQASINAKQMLVPELGWVDQELVAAFDSIRPHVEQAVRMGFTTSVHCQGGACAVTRAMMDRMAAAGYFRETDVWVRIPEGDDMVFAMYAYAVGLRPVDCDVFGVQFSGLPYPLEELVSLGYSIIHAVKDDRRFSEAQVREFFRDRLAETAIPQIRQVRSLCPSDVGSLPTA